MLWLDRFDQNIRKARSLIEIDIFSAGLGRMADDRNDTALLHKYPF